MQKSKVVIVSNSNYMLIYRTHNSIRMETKMTRVSSLNTVADEAISRETTRLMIMSY